MPFRRSTRFRGRARGRRTRFRGRSRFPRRMPMRRFRRVALDPERKLLDATVSVDVSVANALSFNVVGVQEGFTQNTRVGLQILVTSLFVRFQAIPSPTGTGQATLRMIIYIDKMPDQNQPDPTDLMLDVAANPLTAARNIPNALRYQVLRDQTWTWTATTTGVLAKQFYIPLRLKVRYLLNSGAIQSIAANNIVVLFLSQEIPDPNGNPVQVTVKSRLRFVG